MLVHRFYGNIRIKSRDEKGDEIGDEKGLYEVTL